ncbi:MAG: hypothetical protein DWI48_00655 [Chloroflexi bacterium]|nr:MAG: hypothetical protein DWI48_00655 [Chloroflexota bacterium]
MRRWSVPLPGLLSALLIVSTSLALIGCSKAPSTGRSIADVVLRVGEDVGTEVETYEGQMAPGLDAALNADNPNAKDRVALPQPPSSTLVGSGRVARADGSTTFFLMYEVKSAESTVSAAMHDLVDTTPWQVTGGQSSEGVSAFNFQNTRNPGITGSAVVQPLPTTDRFDVNVMRDGKQKSLSVRRRSFVPILGAEFKEKDGGLVVSRVVPGEAATSGLQLNDRVVSLAGKDVKDNASMQTALRSLSTTGDPRTSVVYIMKVAPDLPLQAAFSAPPPRALPKDFPAPFLVLPGTTPVAVRWSEGSAGSTYEVTLLVRASLGDTLKAYRATLTAQKLAITSDTAQGSATSLEFASADGSLSGTAAIDTFEQDDSFTAISLQLRSQAPGRVPPGGSLVPQGTAPAGTPTATGTPRG